MSLPDIIFLTLVCAGYGVFMVTLGSVAWYCREPGFGLAKARVAPRPRV